jgi:hypothetical protein
MPHPIPSEALDNHIAFLGGTGSGKTSAAKREIVEPALKSGKRVIIIDPTDAWWGLRLKADGKTKGYPIHIFGGKHSDFPLRAQDAEVLADAFSKSSDSAVFVTKEMTVSDRTSFFTKFAEVILRRNRGAVYLVIDESHLFMPQAGAQAGGGAPAMLHAGNNLVSLGRSSGFRISLLSQRPAKLHKDSLSQVQTLVAMRVLAPQDRKAIREWMEDQADAEKGREIIASLPTLKPGQGWVWAPLAGVLHRVHFDMPLTFDSSKAPDNDAEGPVLAPLDTEGLQARLATVEADRKANDPSLLKAEISKLKAELAKKPIANTPEQNLAIYDDAFEKGMVAGATKYQPTIQCMVKALKQIAGDAQQASEGVPLPDPTKGVDFRIPEKAAGHTIHYSGIKLPVADQSGTIKPAQRQILTILAQYPAGRSMNKLAVFSGKAMSGGFRNYVYALNNAGLVTKEGDDYRITEAGLQTLGDYTPLPVGSELAAHWMFKLKPAEAQILSAIMTASPRALSMHEIAAAVGKAVSGGFRNYVYHLCSLELISGKGSYTANPDLF